MGEASTPPTELTKTVISLKLVFSGICLIMYISGEFYSV